MSEQEKQDAEVHGTSSRPEVSMTEMEAAARLFALQDRLRAEKADPPRPAPVRVKGSDLPALQEFVEKARAEGPRKPPNSSWRFPVGSPNTLLKKI